MTHGSLFSGIGGFDRGFQLAGIPTVWHAEKEPFCQAILKTHFPEAQLFDDVAKVTKHSARAVDVISGGFPCQDLSVAGKRAGLGGSRSGLFWEVVRIVGELRPAWFVLENVPGLFSSGEGRDFAVVLNALDELGYGLAWRVLNSQFFGVAQRRRRVFIVGRLGEPCPEAVLFEPESGSRDSQARSEAWENLAATITDGTGRVGSKGCDDGANIVASPLGGRMRGQDDSCADNVAAVFVANALSSSAGHHGHSSPRGDGSDNLVSAYSVRAANSNQLSTHASRTERARVSIRAEGSRQTKVEPSSLRPSPPATASKSTPLIEMEDRPTSSSRPSAASGPKDQAGQPETSTTTLPSSQRSTQAEMTEASGLNRESTLSHSKIPGKDGGTDEIRPQPCELPKEADPLRQTLLSVRRLTPTECEILQAFPRGWTVPATEHWGTRSRRQLPNGLGEEF